MISLLWPWALLALPLPWLLSRWLPPVRAASRWVLPWVFGAPAEQSTSAAATAPTPRAAWILWLVWALCCLALTQPVRFDQFSSLKTSGRDLMLAVDISGSMRTEDMRIGGRRINRLDAVKAVLGDFIERRQGDRLGLILFGQQAFMITPLTLDRANVRYQLETSVVGLAGLDTAIGDALGLAVKRLRDRPQNQRIVLLLTDGVNSAGELSPDRATELAVELGVKVYTVGFGGDSDPGMFGFSFGSGGAEIDEAALQKMAESTGGRYFRARDVGELAGIYQALDQLEPIELEAPQRQHQRPLYHYPLALALLLLLIALLARRDKVEQTLRSANAESSGSGR